MDAGNAPCGVCGIAGILDASLAGRERQEILRSQLEAQCHRGPDGRGTLTRQEITLGHCALPFSGTAAEPQPFTTASGRTVVVFNGEVYNRAELADRLASLGVRLRTDSDTEVLAELIERLGPACLTGLRGMFAVAAYRVDTLTLLLARDPMGKKPLYYAELAEQGTGARVVFSSELTALVRHPEIDHAVDPTALLTYLVLRAAPADRSMLRAVRKVPPGGWVQYAPGATTTGTHWHPPAVARPRPGVRQVDKIVEDLLRTAVHRRRRSTDEPLGLLLSGGLDSGLVAAIAQEQAVAEGTGPLSSFTVGFQNPDFDESVRARRVATHLGTDHHDVVLGSADLRRLVEEDLTRVDEPLADDSLLPMFALARLAGNHVRGVLTGDGADEILVGYRYFQAERLIGLLGPRAGGPLLRLGSALFRGLPTRSTNLSLRTAFGRLERVARLRPEHGFALANAALPPAEAYTMLAEELRVQLDAMSTDVAAAPLRGIDEYLAAVGSTRTDRRLRRCQLAVVAHFLREVVLTKVDRSTMLHGLEPRSPFLDQDLVDYCLGLPPEVGMPRFTGKAPLRRIAARHLPTEVVTGTKTGFRAPLDSLVRGELRPLVRDVLSPAETRAAGLFDPDRTTAALNRCLDGEERLTRTVWALFCAQLWRRGAVRTAGRPATIGGTA